MIFTAQNKLENKTFFFLLFMNISGYYKGIFKKMKTHLIHKIF